MTNKEKLRRRVIELIHGCDYDEAIEREMCQRRVIKLGEGKEMCEVRFYPDGLPITLSRLMHALKNSKQDIPIYFGCDDCIFTRDFQEIDGYCRWKLLKPNGETATLDDQTEKTINKLTELLI